MNNQQPNPLQPQGASLDPKNRGRARVKIAVFAVLAVHAVGLMALLMQGCRREEPQEPIVQEDTNNVAVPTMDDTNAVAIPYDTNNINYIPPTNTYDPGMVTSNNGVSGFEQGVAPGRGTGMESVTPQTGTATEYKIQAGDSFYTLGKKFGVSMNAIRDANPKVDPNRLQVGKTILIPAPTSTPRTEVSGATTTQTPGSTVYEVKSGDNLTKIAAKFGVSVKALRSANNLATDQIKVGQKLKIPAK